MSDWMIILRVVLKILFWGLLPAVIIYYRYKKKLTTGFAIGSILTCLIFGLVSSATVEEDPVDNFMYAVNMKEYDAAKKAYKIIIQSGPDELKKIPVKDIIDAAFFKKLKSDVITEYREIASRYIKTVEVKRVKKCDNVIAERKELHKLRHGLLLLDYAGSIGTDHDELKKQLTEKIAAAEKVMAENEKLCE